MVRVRCALLAVFLGALSCNADVNCLQSQKGTDGHGHIYPVGNASTSVSCPGQSFCVIISFTPAPIEHTDATYTFRDCGNSAFFNATYPTDYCKGGAGSFQLPASEGYTYAAGVCCNGANCNQAVPDPRPTRTCLKSDAGSDGHGDYYPKNTTTEVQCVGQGYCVAISFIPPYNENNNSTFVFRDCAQNNFFNPGSATLEDFCRTGAGTFELPPRPFNYTAASHTCCTEDRCNADAPDVYPPGVTCLRSHRGYDKHGHPFPVNNATWDVFCPYQSYCAVASIIASEKNDTVFVFRDCGINNFFNNTHPQDYCTTQGDATAQIYNTAKDGAASLRCCSTKNCNLEAPPAILGVTGGNTPPPTAPPTTTKAAGALRVSFGATLAVVASALLAKINLL